MLNRTSTTGSEFFIVDNCNEDRKVLRYLHDWHQFCDIRRRFAVLPESVIGTCPTGITPVK
jgi:hypothetical protein